MTGECDFCGGSLRSHIESDEFSIHICKRCGIGVTYPEPSVPDYSNMDFHSNTVSQEQSPIPSISTLPPDWRRLIQIQVALSVKYVPANARILELGCGEGILLKELQNAGYLVHGIEPSTSAVTRGKEMGLSMTNDSFPQKVPEGPFDMVIASHVLEHVSDHNSFIHAISQTLSNGFLILTQTNYRGLIPRITKRRWYAWVPDQHYWHFTEKGLSGYLEKFGYKHLETVYSSLVHPPTVFYKLSRTKPTFSDQFTSIFKYPD